MRPSAKSSAFFSTICFFLSGQLTTSTKQHLLFRQPSGIQVKVFSNALIQCEGDVNIRYQHSLHHQQTLIFLFFLSNREQKYILNSSTCNVSVLFPTLKSSQSSSQRSWTKFMSDSCGRTKSLISVENGALAIGSHAQ